MSEQTAMAGAAGAGAVEAQIREVERARIAALLACDYDAFEALLDERLVYTHATARRDTREAQLASLRGGAYRYLEMETDPQQIDVLGDAVVVAGNQRAVIEIGGDAGERRSVYTQVWARRGDDWKLLCMQATAIPA